MSKTVQFQTIQFSIRTQFSSIRPIDRTLLGATTPDQSGPRSNGNKGVLYIPQNSNITESSPSDLFSVISKIFVGEVLPMTEMQLVHSTAPADWATRTLVRGSLIHLQRCSQCILQPHPSWLGLTYTCLHLYAYELLHLNIFTHKKNLLYVIITIFMILYMLGPIGWGCRIHWLHLCRGIRLLHQVSWWSSWLGEGLQNTLIASLQRGKTPPTSVLVA